jgi:hypothetical protein
MCEWQRNKQAQIMRYILQTNSRNYCTTPTDTELEMEQKEVCKTNRANKLYGKYKRDRKIAKKETISSVMSVRLPVWRSAWKNSAPTGRIFMKFHFFFSKICPEKSTFNKI